MSSLPSRHNHKSPHSIPFPQFKIPKPFTLHHHHPPSPSSATKSNPPISTFVTLPIPNHDLPLLRCFVHRNANDSATSLQTPLRKLLIIGLDRAKRGRAPLVVKSVGATVFVIMMYNVYSVTEIQSRPADVVNPTDQILLAYHMLEASLMGFSLFLSLMIDRLHHYIRELRILRKTMETAKKQNRAAEETKNKGADEAKILNDEVSKLKETIKTMESEYETKEKEIKSAEANSLALKNQSEGFLLEYDRLLAENQHLRDQLRAIDESVSHSSGKKNT